MNETETQFSYILSNTLDCLGYSYSAIRRRIDGNAALADKVSKFMQHDDKSTQGKFYLVGSKGEGISLSFESDFDYMTVLPEILCSGKSNRCGATLKFQLDRLHQPHGYTKLRLVFRSLNIDEWPKQLVHVDGNLYLSNDTVLIEKFQKYMVKKSAIPMKVQPRSGPANPTTTSIGTIDTNSDFVVAIRCICTSYLDLWCSRKRYHGFPARDLIQRITALDAHVVPVGLKLSDENDLQWRICFTLGEICIIQSFNEVQLKVFILLKKLVKCSIKPVCPDITSYVVKNIIFWVFENTPRHLFVESNLTRLLIRSVHFLWSCVKVGYIPNYMIPQRNLIIGKLSPDMSSKLRKKLNCFLNEAGGMVFQCNNIQREMKVLLRNPQLSTMRRELVEAIEIALYEATGKCDADVFLKNILINGDYHKYMLFLYEETCCKAILNPGTKDIIYRLFLCFCSIDKKLMDNVISLLQIQNNTVVLQRFMRSVNIKECVEWLLSNQNGVGRLMHQILPLFNQRSLIQMIEDKMDGMDLSQPENVIQEVVGDLLNNTDYYAETFKLISENPQTLLECLGVAGYILPFIPGQTLQELQKMIVTSLSPEQCKGLFLNETVLNFLKALFSGQ